MRFPGLSGHSISIPLLGLLVTVPISAQTIRGVVVVAESDSLLEGATVQLVGPDGTPVAMFLTEKDGTFALKAPDAGRYLLRVRRIGYRPQYAAIEFGGEQTIDIRVNLAPQVTLLEAVTILGETAETPGQREFLSRRQLKWGYSFNRTEIEQLQAGTVGWVIKLGAPLVISRCMTVYLDGSPSKTFGDKIPLDWVYGIEVYPSYFDIPLKYRDSSLGKRCGAVLLWSTTIGKD